MEKNKTSKAFATTEPNHESEIPDGCSFWSLSLSLSLSRSTEIASFAATTLCIACRLSRPSASFATNSAQTPLSCRPCWVMLLVVGWVTNFFCWEQHHKKPTHSLSLLARQNETTKQQAKMRSPIFVPKCTQSLRNSHVFPSRLPHKRQCLWCYVVRGRFSAEAAEVSAGRFLSLFPLLLLSFSGMAKDGNSPRLTASSMRSMS